MAVAEAIDFKNNVLSQVKKLFSLSYADLSQLTGYQMLYTVHDQFYAVIKELGRRGYAVEYRKFCGSPISESVLGLPEYVEGKDYRTNAHGRLETYRPSSLSAGKTFAIDGQDYFVAYKKEYHGSAMTPGYQWIISVKIPSTGLLD